MRSPSSTGRLVGEATNKAAKVNHWLLPEGGGALEAEGLERTWNFKQQDIQAAVEVGAAQKAIDLSLKDLGPYTLDFTASGRHMVIGGQKGHLAILDWPRYKLICEEQVGTATGSKENYALTSSRKGVRLLASRNEVLYLQKHFLSPFPSSFFLPVP
jgi:U3 small nucleolar RNA-associated protein 7